VTTTHKKDSCISLPSTILFKIRVKSHVMQFESLFRSPFSNQSLRLYKKISFTRRQGCRFSAIPHNLLSELCQKH